MTDPSSGIAALNTELDAADQSLVGNPDVLRSVLSGCGDCIKILDLAGRLQFMSEGGKRVMEVDDFGALKGCPWPDFWAGEGNAEAKRAIASAALGRTGRFKGEANTARGNARAWDVTVSPIFGADGAVSNLLSISRDITAEWRAEAALREAADRQRVLTEEMNHRVSNTFAIVSAIATQTMRGDDVGVARMNFLARLNALADANRLLLQSGWAGAPVAEVVRRSMAPHDPGANRIAVSGPDLHLPPRHALSMALAVHELATNAMKYGALSNADGRVAVRWSADGPIDDGQFDFTWEESGGPVLSGVAPARSGFGSRLIQSIFAKDFDGVVTLDYDTTGVVCRLRSPLSALVNVGADDRAL